METENTAQRIGIIKITHSGVTVVVKTHGAVGQRIIRSHYEKSKTGEFIQRQFHHSRALGVGLERIFLPEKDLAEKVFHPYSNAAFHTGFCGGDQQSALDRGGSVKKVSFFRGQQFSFGGGSLIRRGLGTFFELQSVDPHLAVSFAQAGRVDVDLHRTGTVQLEGENFSCPLVRDGKTGDMLAVIGRITAAGKVVGDPDIHQRLFSGAALCVKRKRIGPGSKDRGGRCHIVRAMQTAEVITGVLFGTQGIKFQGVVSGILFFGLHLIGFPAPPVI